MLGGAAAGAASGAGDTSSGWVSPLGIFCVPVAALEPSPGRISSWDRAEAQDEVVIHHPGKDHLPLRGAPLAQKTEDNKV